MEEREDTTIYKVVLNHEEQYSIWPAERENPLGWRDAGKVGPKAECLAYIKEVWTDMRPLSLRRRWRREAKLDSFGILGGGKCAALAEMAGPHVKEKGNG